MGKAKGRVHSWLVDALILAFSILRAHGGKRRRRKSGNAASSLRSSGACLCVQSFSGIYLCVYVCASTQNHSTLYAVRNWTLTVFFHQLETACCSYSQLIGGWPVTLATQAVWAIFYLIRFFFLVSPLKCSKIALVNEMMLVNLIIWPLRPLHVDMI